MDAIEKINAEMQKNASDQYTEIIGQYIIDRCSDPVVASHVANDNLTLQGAMKSVLALAQKHKNGNVAVLTPSQVFGVIDEYFGIPTDTAAQFNAVQQGDSYQAPVPSGSLDLSDFL